MQTSVAQRGDRREFLDRAIDQQHAVDARIDRLASEARYAVNLDRVHVTHQHDGCVCVARAKVAHPVEYLLQAHAARERAFAGVLDHRAVGHRIGERNAELDQIGTDGDQRVHEVDGRFRQGIAGGDKRDQTGAAFGFQLGEASVDAVHKVIPSRAAIVCTSLSPRPDRLHRISWSFGSSRASLIACATAWLDSSAARMPSLRASS